MRDRYMSVANSKLRTFPTGLSLEQERSRAIVCPWCHMLVFWNTRAIHRRTGKPMLCDAVLGGPQFNQGHYCSILFEKRKEQRYLQESLDNFVASVRPSTAIIILGEEGIKEEGEEDGNDKDKNKKKIITINENVSFVIKKKKEKKKNKESSSSL